MSKCNPRSGSCTIRDYGKFLKTIVWCDCITRTVVCTIMLLCTTIVFVALRWSNGIDQRPMIAFADIWVLFVCLLGKHFLLYLLSHFPWDYYSRPKFIKTILPNVSSNRTTIAQRHYIILYLWYLWCGVSFPLRKWINGSGHVKCT